IGKEEVVPDADEDDHGDGGETRSREGYDDSPEDGEVAGALDHRCFLNVARQTEQEGAKDHERKREEERRVEEDQADLRVEETELADDEEFGSRKPHDWHGKREAEGGGEAVAEREPEASDRIGGKQRRAERSQG